jgi:membrane peptidoglycan carboxypeptidase
LTLITEVLYSKDQILEMYFNQTPYGGTLWGAQAAARGIFEKDVKDLNLAESALLAGLPQSPTTYSPFSRPELAKNRQIQVLIG